jgi:hypothetical protein
MKKKKLKLTKMNLKHLTKPTKNRAEEIKKCEDMLERDLSVAEEFAIKNYKKSLENEQKRK